MFFSRVYHLSQLPLVSFQKQKYIMRKKEKIPVTRMRIRKVVSENETSKLETFGFCRFLSEMSYSIISVKILYIVVNSS